MTPKEKAKELIEKFKIEVKVYYTEDSVPNIMKAPLTRNTSKELALIAVDEIINNNALILDMVKFHRELNFWKEVIQEIKKI